MYNYFGSLLLFQFLPLLKHDAALWSGLQYLLYGYPQAASCSIQQQRDARSLLRTMVAMDSSSPLLLFDKRFPKGYANAFASFVERVLKYSWYDHGPSIRRTQEKILVDKLSALFQNIFRPPTLGDSIFYRSGLRQFAAEVMGRRLVNHFERVHNYDIHQSLYSPSDTRVGLLGIEWLVLILEEPNSSMIDQMLSYMVVLEGAFEYYRVD
ncbi:hypothetical protein BJ508DRAFT_314612 [Ascobolus immersus RN42]|uniref:Uncharacterized protein n=1 Tax=Ascobolus immersus RN42 TaxID=1160509 RepID=A0A3N4HEE9_ASCIM|nr:hypothetical protein BJ508DRAFT_314612 [Ascobolus immersus RN42]